MSDLESEKESIEPRAASDEPIPAAAPVPPAPPVSAADFAPAPDWAPPAPPAAARSNPWRLLVASFVVGAMVAALGGIGIGFTLAKALKTPSSAQAPISVATPIGTAPSNGQNAGTLNAQAIAAKVDPAIVDINTVTGSGNAAGTGMILTSSGEVLTNNHVVDLSTSIEVTIAGRSNTYKAHLIGTDPTADIALIQIEGVSGLPTVKLASSSTLQVGDPVVALGNALGRGGAPSVTQGTITALDQTITASEGGSKSEQLNGMIEADAVISPGDSGGPLVNSAGQVIGMITAGEAQGFRSNTSSIDYAVPSSTLLSVANQIRSGQASPDIIYGQVGYLGVGARDLTPALAAQLGLNLSEGALISTVQSGSPADAAGIPQDSVITAIGGTTVTSSATLGTAIRSHKPGDRVSVTYVDQSGTHTVTATLGGVN